MEKEVNKEIRQTYRKPELQELGEVKVLTRTGSITVTG